MGDTVVDTLVNLLSTAHFLHRFRFVFKSIFFFFLTSDVSVMARTNIPPCFSSFSLKCGEKKPFEGLLFFFSFRYDCLMVFYKKKKKKEKKKHFLWSRPLGDTREHHILDIKCLQKVLCSFGEDILIRRERSSLTVFFFKYQNKLN